MIISAINNDNKDGKVIKITDKKGVSLEITLDEALLIEELANRHYYRRDVISRINEMIEAEVLPEEALNDKEWIDAVVSSYSELRRDNEGSADGVDWETCLDIALKNESYGDEVERFDNR